MAASNQGDAMDVAGASQPAGVTMDEKPKENNDNTKDEERSPRLHTPSEANCNPPDSSPGQGPTSLSNGIFPTHIIGKNSPTHNSLALKALYGREGPPPPPSAPNRQDRNRAEPIGKPIEPNYTLHPIEQLPLSEKKRMKKKLDALIAEEVPRLDANPPHLPKAKRVARSAKSESSVWSQKMTAGYDSENEIDLEDNDHSMDESHPPPEKTSARKERRTTKRCNDVRNWQNGKNRNCTPYRINDDIEAATVRNLQEVVGKMQKLGYAVLMDFKEATDDPEGTLNPMTYNIFKPENAPTPAQAAFYKTPLASSRQPPVMETIFEGVMINQAHAQFLPQKPTVARPGTEIRSVMKYGLAGYKAYQKQCKGQADDIITGMFPAKGKRNKPNPAADPRNWVAEHNVVVGGVDHQHPHCDQGKAGSYQNDDIFPFVAVHGFGVNEFQMWLLPQKLKREYGFLYNFPKNAILFMRGDFIHAGACLQPARGHIHFFPHTAAGWDDDNPYWSKARFEAWIKDPPSYVIQDLRFAPFAYPKFSKRNAVGNQVITYPASLTADLITPVKRLKPVKKRKRTGKGKESSEDSGSDCDADLKADATAEIEKRKALVRRLHKQKY
jgi:hypothetical protein